MDREHPLSELTLDPGTVALLDQFEAEDAACEALAPRNLNCMLMRDERIQSTVRRALTRLPKNIEDFGPVPVITFEPFHPFRSIWATGYYAYERDGDKPIKDDAPVHTCARCHESMRDTLPFWVGCGWVIVQITLCMYCSELAVVEWGAVPQGA